ncbi:hypothetical protein X801_05253 [Opisthorchis viverrini]|uniref:Serine-threonine/tyrosine-protein kinase catalytic domain-containing protein n=1 Tax=Opisthorchis viverrini TaxID=6198 RepID=A0A1S8WWQ3_OPIVI|nr:hypothetical protein X801_05253 [Opisthorchis viverrini]
MTTIHILTSNPTGVLMWEVFTCCAEIPYQGKNNNEVYQHIIAGGRLQKPAVCPQNIYVLMLECWQHRFLPNKSTDVYSCIHQTDTNVNNYAGGFLLYAVLISSAQ